MGSITWISGNEDMAALFRRNGQADGKSVFLLQSSEETLLFSPLMASLAFRTLVWFWEELFDGDNGDGFSRRDDIIEFVPMLAGSSLLPTSRSDGSVAIIVPIVVVPITRTRSVPIFMPVVVSHAFRSRAGTADVLESGNRRTYSPIVTSERSDVVP